MGNSSILVALCLLLFCSLSITIPVLQTGNCTFDFDGDGVCDGADNCPYTANANQNPDVCSYSFIGIFYDPSSVSDNDSLKSDIVSEVCSAVGICSMSEFSFEITSTSNASVYQMKVRFGTNAQMESIVALFNEDYPDFLSRTGFLSSVVTLQTAKTLPPTNLDKPGSTLLPQITLPCRRYIVITNNLSFPFVYSVKANNENPKAARNGTLAVGATRSFVFQTLSDPADFYVVLNHVNDDPRLHHPTVYHFLDDDVANETCLNVVPICRNVYNVTTKNIAFAHRYEFQWSSLKNNVTGVGSVAAGSTYQIYTGVGRADEVLQVNLIDHNNLPKDSRKEFVALGRRKDCNALI